MLQRTVRFAIGSCVLALSCFILPNLHAQYEGSKAVPNDLREGFDSITADQARQWLGILAGPRFGGRGTGQPGFIKAAHWVAGKVAEFGLEPMGEGGTYFQMMPMPRLNVDAEQTKLTIGELTLNAPGNLGFDRFAGEAQVQGKLAFIRSKGNQLQLADDVNLEDQIVILATDEDGGMRSAFAIMRKRPAAILRVIEGVPVSSTQTIRAGGRGRASGIAGTISKAAAQKLAAAAGGKPAWVEPAAGDTPEIDQTDAMASIEIRSHQEDAAYPNVCAWIEGSDPQVNDEYIVIGAHLDHLGTRGDEIYFGADDNGSGSTAILNIARAIAENPVKPKRSVLFIWFTGEEMGLLGSGYYCDHPILPLDKMICMFNIDMVGRNEEKEGDRPEDNIKTIHLIGSKQGNLDLHDVIMKANEYVNFEFEYDEEGVFGRSDQANFFRKAHTSVAFLFGGFHPDYHRPTDQPSKINYDKIASAAKLYYMAIYLAAEHGPFPLPTTTSSNPQ